MPAGWGLGHEHLHPSVQQRVTHPHAQCRAGPLSPLRMLQASRWQCSSVTFHNLSEASSHVATGEWASSLRRPFCWPCPPWAEFLGGG